MGGGGPPSHRQTKTVLIGTRTLDPHTPDSIKIVYFKPAPPLHHPRHNDLLGLHRLIMGMEKYDASPAESPRLKAYQSARRSGKPCPWGVLVFGSDKCITARLVARGVGIPWSESREGPAVLGWGISRIFLHTLACRSCMSM